MMSDATFIPRVLAALAAVTILAGIAAPTHATEEVALPADALEEEVGTLEALADSSQAAVEDTAEATTNGVEAALQLVGDALSAVASGVAAGASALATALVATLEGIGGAAAWTGGLLASCASLLITGIAAALKHAGHGLASSGAALASLIAGATAWLAHLSLDLALWTGSAWPDQPTHQALLATSASGTAAAAGAAWYTRAWRYAKYLPGLLPLYSRIQPDDLLDHPKRQRIYELVQSTPGVHLSQMARELDVPWGTLVHHLRKLEKGDLITSEEKSGKRCFFLPGQVTGAQRDILPALENETARRIAEFYAENPGASQNEAADALDHSPALISWHLNKLEDAGVVTRERVGRRQRVGVTQEAQAVVA